MSTAPEQPEVSHNIHGMPNDPVEHHVPFDIIRDESSVYLDPEHRARLAEDIRVNGQTTPVELARSVDDTHLIAINGLYRLSILRREQGADCVRATVQDATQEEIADARIRNVLHHTLPELGRAVLDMQTAWSYTPWAAEGVPLSTAVYVSAKMSTSQLEPDKAVAIRQWFAGKWSIWGAKPTSIKRGLDAIDGVAPDLVDMTKIASARTSKTLLTISHLAAIRNNTEPHDYEQQRLFARILLDYPLPINMLSEFFRQTKGSEKDPVTIAIQLQKAAVDRAHSGQQRSTMSRREKRTRTRRAPTAGQVVGAQEASDGEVLAYSRTFGHVAFNAIDYRSPDKQDKVIRIYNLQEVNQLSRERAQQMGREPKELDINAVGRTFIGGHEILGGSLQMEMLNALLVSYLCQPMPSIKDLHEVYGFAIERSYQERSRWIWELHRELTRWHYQGLVAYNEKTAKGAALYPILISDHRSTRQPYETRSPKK